MSNITQLTTVPADLIGAQVATPAPKPAESTTPSAGAKANATSKTDSTTTPKAPSAEPANASQRLVISEGARTGVYIYTILDRATGQVLVQIPREEVVKIAASPDYTSGKVIDTKV